VLAAQYAAFAAGRLGGTHAVPDLMIIGLAITLEPITPVAFPAPPGRPLAHGWRHAGRQVRAGLNDWISVGRRRATPIQAARKLAGARQHENRTRAEKRPLEAD
jgi:hypothetical protein